MGLPRLPLFALASGGTSRDAAADDTTEATTATATVESPLPPPPPPEVQPEPEPEGEPEPAGLTLWPYQETAVARVWEELYEKGRRSTLLVMPTGCGKTVSFGSVARRVIETFDESVLILAHRGELLEQAQAKLDFLGVESVVEKAEQDARVAIRDAACSIVNSRRIRCIVGSVQTLRGRRLESWPSDYFGLVIVDECHHSPARSYRDILEHFCSAKVLGVTATADRLDGENLGGLFESLAFEYPLVEAVAEGWLVRPVCDKSPVEVDLRGIKTTGGDFNLGELEDRISANIEPLVNDVAHRIGDRKTIVFTPDVGSAHAFAEGLRKLGVSAVSVSGKSHDRQTILRDFSAGRFQVLANCQLLTEGYDETAVSAIVLARPTRSRALYAQMIGRGLRRHEGKTDCQIIDFSWLSDKHSLVSPVELIHPEADEETAAIFDELMGSGRIDVLEAAEAARAAKRQRDEQRERELVRQEEIRLRLRVRPRAQTEGWQRFDPLGLSVASLSGVRPVESLASKRIQATEKQIACLVRFGVDEAEAAAMSRRRASETIDWLVTRRSAGLCTYKQLRALVKGGVDRDVAAAFTLEEASAVLDDWRRTGWGRRTG